MKNKILKVIKGIIISFILVSTLCLNLNETIITIAKPELAKSSEITYEVSDYSFIPTAYAAEGDEAAPTNNAESTTPQDAFDPEALINKVAELATYVHKLFHPLINFFAFHVGNFLGTDYIFAGSMGDMLKSIWTISRNLVNIIFVLILLGLALKEIFWVNDEGSTLKKSLVKFTLLLVAVNFSWLGTKVVLDAANVATNVVFSIPMGVSTAATDINFEPCDVAGDDTLNGMCYPSEIYMPTDSEDTVYYNQSDCESKKIGELYDKAYLPDGSPNPELTYEEQVMSQGGTVCWDSLNLTKYNKNTAVVYMTYGMARIQNLVKSSNPGDKISQLAVGILFSLLIQVAYTISLLALFIAMIIRMAVLWVFVGFSPFLVLMLFSDKFKEGIGDKFSIDAFGKWAFVPVKVGAVFSVAFLMVSAGQSVLSVDEKFFDKLDQGGSAVTAKMFKVKSLFMGMDTLQEFIWLLVTLVVLWAGTFAVLGDMPIIKSFTDKINDYGTRTAKWLAKTPYWAPIMPMVDKQGNFKLGSYEKEYGAVFKAPQLLEKYRRKVVDGDVSAANFDKVNKAVERHKADGGASARTMENHINTNPSNAAAKIAAMYSITPAAAHEMGASFKQALADSGVKEEYQTRIMTLMQQEATTDKRIASQLSKPIPDQAENKQSNTQAQAQQQLQQGGAQSQVNDGPQQGGSGPESKV